LKRDRVRRDGETNSKTLGTRKKRPRGMKRGVMAKGVRKTS